MRISDWSSDVCSSDLEIVVTAQKREQGVQKTAIAITAIGGADLRTAGVASVSGLMNSVPNLEIGQSYGTANISLRGISLAAVSFGTENPIAFHVDGVFMARPAGALASFYDVERVEVLRGAQGTLYGRNATGGSINIITANPTENFSGFAQLKAGNQSHLTAEAGGG